MSVVFRLTDAFIYHLKRQSIHFLTSFQAPSVKLCSRWTLQFIPKSHDLRPSPGPVPSYYHHLQVMSPTSPEANCYSMTHLSQTMASRPIMGEPSHIQRRLDPSRGSRPTYNGVSTSHRGAVPHTTASRPLTGGPSLILASRLLTEEASIPPIVSTSHEGGVPFFLLKLQFRVFLYTFLHTLNFSPLTLWNKSLTGKWRNLIPNYETQPSHTSTLTTTHVQTSHYGDIPKHATYIFAS